MLGTPEGHTSPIMIRKQPPPGQVPPPEIKPCEPLLSLNKALLNSKVVSTHL